VRACLAENTCSGVCAYTAAGRCVRWARRLQLPPGRVSFFFLASPRIWYYWRSTSERHTLSTPQTRLCACVCSLRIIAIHTCAYTHTYAIHTCAYTHTYTHTCICLPFRCARHTSWFLTVPRSKKNSHPARCNASVCVGLPTGASCAVGLPVCHQVSHPYLYRCI
jgi:hypothetical protein